MPNNSRYSATVKLTLIAPSGECNLAGISPHLITLRSPAKISRGPATVVSLVDGRETRWHVDLDRDVAPADGTRITVSLGECVPDESSRQAG